MPNYNEKLYHAIRNNDFSGITCALNAGANINNSEYASFSPITLAADTGNMNNVKYLLDKGAHISKKDREGRTALFVANKNGNFDLVSFLEEKLNDPDFAWKRLGNDCIAKQSVSALLGKQLTEIFNFTSRQGFSTIENLDTGSEEITQSISFNEFPEETLKTALSHFKRLGGSADDEFVLTNTQVRKRHSLGKTTKANNQNSLSS